MFAGIMESLALLMFPVVPITGKKQEELSYAECLLEKKQNAIYLRDMADSVKTDMISFLLKDYFTH